MNRNPLQAREVFVAAVKLPPDELEQYLDRACAGDGELRERVADLLRAHREIGGFMEQPAVAAPADEPAVVQTATATFQAATEEPGTWFGPYKLLQRLGEGGMGVVWAAEQAEPVKRRVALKVIKPGMDSVQVLRRFEAERQALALMDHSNIAKVLDAGTTAELRMDDPTNPQSAIRSADRPTSLSAQNPQLVAGRPYFVMELVKGVRITKYCDELHLSLRERLELFLPVCHATQHAHQKGIIHRDIKPSNVLVAIQDGKPVPKVIDFGVAKALHQNLAEGSVYTEIGQVVGTLEYMSPEQAELSALDVDTRTDIYALGVLLYELLTGTTPLDRKRLKQAAYDEMLRMIRELEPPKPSTRLSESKESLAGLAAQRRTEPARLTKAVRGELDWIVMKALEKDRTRRYETADGLARDVARHLADEPVEAGPPSTRYRVRKFLRRHKRPVLAAALVLLALVGGVIGTTWGLFRAVRAENNAVVARDAEVIASRNAVAARDAEATARKNAEVLALGVQTDQALETMGEATGDAARTSLGLLRLAHLLSTVPDHAPEWKQYLTMSVLAWGQEICPLVPPLKVDGFKCVKYVWSDDGKFLLTRIEGQPGTLHLWEVPSGRLRTILHVRGDPTFEHFDSFSFSTDGRAVWAVEGDKRSPDVFLVRFWDSATGSPRGATLKHPSDVSSVTFASDGERCVTVCDPSYPRVKGEEPTQRQLWDTRSGSRIAVLTERSRVIAGVSFTPDARFIVAWGPDGVQIWRARDGEEVRALTGLQDGVATVAFSPSGQRLATAVTSRPEIRWWRVDDWQPDGPACTYQEHYYSWVEDMKFINEDVLYVRHVSDIVNCCVHGRSEAAAFSPYRVKDRFVLSDEGHVFELPTLRSIPGAGYHRFPAEAAEFAEDGRHLLLPTQMLDLVTERRIGPSMRICRVGAGRVGWVFADLNSQFRTATWTCIPEPTAALDATAVALWARLVARGELNSDREFSAWDEATWEAKRQELVRITPPNGTFPFPGQVAIDRLYWLRRELHLAKQLWPPSPNPKAVQLQDRLVAAEPTWRNYHDRSRMDGRPYELRFHDALEAARLAGPAYWRSEMTAPHFWEMTVPDQPRSQYELVLRWLDHEEAGRGQIDQRNRALALYRLGRYPEALACLGPADIGDEGDTKPIDRVSLMVASMCQYQLGDADKSRATLRKVEKASAGMWLRDLFEEAQALIEPTIAEPVE